MKPSRDAVYEKGLLAGIRRADAFAVVVAERMYELGRTKSRKMKHHHEVVGEHDAGMEHRMRQVRPKNSASSLPRRHIADE